MMDDEGRVRICHLERVESGFGFVLCCENDTTDTFVLHVLNDSPAALAGLKTGDRIVEINGINVETECHTDVVKILQGLKNLRLVVAFNKQANEYFSKPCNGMTVRPLDATSEVLRPKIIIIHKGQRGYDFVVKTVGKSNFIHTGRMRQNLKGVTGHFVDSVDRSGHAFSAGLRAGERIIEINNINVEKESHAYVIAAIKTSPNRTVELLVVDKNTDQFFQSHCVSPASHHVHGELNFGEIIDKSNYDISDSDATPPVSPFTSTRTSTPSSTPTSEHSPIQPSIASLDAITKKTEELIKELKIHNDEIMNIRSTLGYSRSYVEPSMRDKYLNLVTRDANSNPGSPEFRRNHGYRSTTSSSDDDHSLVLNNNNHQKFTYTPVKNLSEVGYNVNLQTLKEHARRKVGRNKSMYRDKVGYGSYVTAHRALNNI